MKQLFTLIIIILSAGLKLSASVYQSDTLKLSAANHQDSLKTLAGANHQDILKSSALINHSDTVKFLASVNQTDNLKLPLYLNYPVSLKLLSSADHSMLITPAYRSDSLRFLASVNKTDSLKLPLYLNYPVSIKLLAPANHADSLMLIMLAYRLDSLNFLATVNQTDNLRLPLYLNYPKNAVLSVAVNNYYYLKLPALVNHPDSLKKPVVPLQSLQNFRQQIRSYGLDSLKLMVRSAPNDPFKALLYSEIANRYLIYDTISNKRKRLNYQNEALSYTMMALHQYSAFSDTLGLRASFDTLAKVYIAQKKYSQAKWFILQSNTISRDRRDVPNIISSLITLSAIKSNIKDYTLAMGDLNEALQLSITNHYAKLESAVLRNYAMLYSRLKNYPKEALMLKKRDSLEDSIRKNEEARLLAKVTAKDSLQNKKLDLLQNKKKAYTSNIPKPYKGNSSRKTASL